MGHVSVDLLGDLSCSTSCATHLHGRDLARNREVHELVPDLHRQASHQRRVDLRLEDDGLVSANLIEKKNTDAGVYTEESC